MVGDHSSRRLPAQVDRDSSGEQRLEAAARLRHLAAALVPVPRCAPTDFPRAR